MSVRDRQPVPHPAGISDLHGIVGKFFSIPVALNQDASGLALFIGELGVSSGFWHVYGITFIGLLSLFLCSPGSEGTSSENLLDAIRAQLQETPSLLEAQCPGRDAGESASMCQPQKNQSHLI